MVAHCLLVETERDGLVLVDTGFGTRDIEGKTGLSRTFRTMVGPTLDRQETAIEQVRARGFDPRDVPPHRRHPPRSRSRRRARRLPATRRSTSTRASTRAAMARSRLQGARALPDGALGARPEVGGLHRGRRHLARPARDRAAARPRRRHRPSADARPHARSLGDHREERRSLARARRRRLLPPQLASTARARCRSGSPRSSARRRWIRPRAARRSPRSASSRASYTDLDLFCAHDPREYAALAQ